MQLSALHVLHFFQLATADLIMERSEKILFILQAQEKAEEIDVGAICEKMGEIYRVMAGVLKY